ncbi:MAG: hypothetical protein GWN62_12985, partial [Aliifodinibius sp.]|nr:hypothetical protein [Fodinibius sp.]
MEYAKAPTDLMIEQAGESANYFTFMDAPGAATRHALAIRNMVPLARTQIPFINTIVNLFKRGIEMTPGIGLLPKAGREVLKSPKQAGPKVTDVVAKQIEGLMIASEIAYLYDQGRITGPAPKNAAKKMAFYQAGFQPWSVKLGDNWYSYRRIEPFNTVIGSVAIALQAWEESGEVPPTETILRIGSGVAGNVLDGTYLQGTLALQKAIEYGETNPQRLQNLIDRTMASFM